MENKYLMIAATIVGSLILLTLITMITSIIIANRTSKLNSKQEKTSYKVKDLESSISKLSEKFLTQKNDQTPPPIGTA